VKIVGTASSEAQPQSGQDHRSGYNFQLHPNFEDSKEITLVVDTPGVIFDIKEDIAVLTDPTPATTATNGTKLPAGTLKKGSKYYIANPQHATKDFAVTLTQE
jgi:hypothetical protein